MLGTKEYYMAKECCKRRSEREDHSLEATVHSSDALPYSAVVSRGVLDIV